MERGSFPHYFRILRQLARMKIDLALTRIYFRYWGVNCGVSPVVGGVPLIRRTPLSTLTIGSHCTFLSTWNYNLHGLTRPCMLSTVKRDARLRIGDYSGFSGTVIVCSTSINIGERVMCGANSTIVDTDSHSLDYRQRYPRYHGLEIEGFKEDVRSSPITIEDDVFIGMNTTILKGVTIGERSVIAACSVVTNSIPSNCIAGGVPARVLRSQINN